MTVYVAFLRAVNVGGTGKLPMADLRKMCGELGFGNVRTYIASGNLVLKSDRSSADVRRMLEDRLREYAGRDVGVVVRTAAEIRAVVEGNPFPDANPSRTLVSLLNDNVPGDAADRATGLADEEVVTGRREIYVLYPQGMSRSKLRIPDAEAGTARNMNTVRRMAELSPQL